MATAKKILDAALTEFTPEDMAEIVRKLVDIAKEGDLRAADWLLKLVTPKTFAKTNPAQQASIQNNYLTYMDMTVDELRELHQKNIKREMTRELIESRETESSDT